MTQTTYNAITTVIAACALIAVLGVIVSLVAMIIRWKTPKRRGHVIRLVAATLAVPCLIGIQWVVTWWIFLPALASEQMANLNALRAEHLAKTSVVHVGDPVPDFALQTADGEDFSISEAKGSVVVLNFFATWCGPCQIELPHIEQIWAENRDNQNFQLIVIGREESHAKVLEYRQKKGFTFPIAGDPERQVYSLFARESIPRTVVVSPEGTIVYSSAGFYEADIEQLMSVLSEQMAAPR